MNECSCAPSVVIMITLFVFLVLTLPQIWLCVSCVLCRLRTPAQPLLADASNVSVVPIMTRPASLSLMKPTTVVVTGQRV
jgi:hypothetical protein